MPRIAMAECKQEVSTFSPARSRFDDFRIVRGPALLDHHRRVREEVGGALSVFDADRRVEFAPAFGASAITSGGLLLADDFQRLCDQFLGDLADAGPVDAAYFSLHGAMQVRTKTIPRASCSRRHAGSSVRRSRSWCRWTCTAS